MQGTKWSRMEQQTRELEWLRPGVKKSGKGMAAIGRGKASEVRRAADTRQIRDADGGDDSHGQ